MSATENPNPEKCPWCKFWKLAKAYPVPGRGDVLFGFCRFNAPVLMPGYFGWPITDENEFCGHFQPKPADSQKNHQKAAC